jgi:hypothetical protein
MDRLKNYDETCRDKFTELLATTPRQSGYSPSQLLSVVVVMECDIDRAKQLLDAEWGDLDWSEATWEETRDYFCAVEELLAESQVSK